MKVAFVYGPFSLGSRPFDLPDVWRSERGLTGSELAWFMYGFGLSKLGHDVTFVTAEPKCPHVVSLIEKLEGDVEGYDVLPVKDREDFDWASQDVVCAWNEPDLLRATPAKCVRVLNQQLNDFGYCKLGWEEHADLVTGPSDWHVARCSRMTAIAGRWRTLPNGCEPAWYTPGKKVPGRVVYASSPDRGLHLLLQAWPEIRRRAPHAHLKIFYRNLQEWSEQFAKIDQHAHQDYVELGRRARYVLRASWHLEKLGVEVAGAVSREKMAEELSQAEVLAYPCDTFTPTEGFSVAIMEGCASGALPVTTQVDALGQIYGGWVPTVASARGEGLKEWTDLVVKALTDAEYAKRWRVRARELADRHRWADLATRFEGMLEQAVVEKERAA